MLNMNHQNWTRGNRNLIFPDFFCHFHLSIACPCATDQSAQLSDYSTRQLSANKEVEHRPRQVVAEEPTAAAEPAARRTAPPSRRSLLCLQTEELTETQKMKQQMMLHLAQELGYVCYPLRQLKADISQQLYCRMTNRLGKAVYQTIQFNLSCPKAAAMALFRHATNLLVHEEEKSMSWEAESMEQLGLLVGDLLGSISPTAAGLTRAVQPPSETLARVFACLIPPMIVSHSVHQHGAEKIYVLAKYVLFDNAGGISAPKNSEQREIALDSSLQVAVRQQCLQDVLQISASPQCNLSAFWWRQLGREDLALEVEAGRLTRRQRERAVQSAPAASAPAATTTYDVAEILDERKSTGAAKSYVLVRWTGYQPSWEAWRISGEPGTPLETWEPLRNVRRTEAYARWMAAKEVALTAVDAEAAS